MSFRTHKRSLILILFAVRTLVTVTFLFATGCAHIRAGTRGPASAAVSDAIQTPDDSNSAFPVAIKQMLVEKNSDEALKEIKILDIKMEGMNKATVHYLLTYDEGPLDGNRVNYTIDATAKMEKPGDSWKVARIVDQHDSFELLKDNTSIRKKHNKRKQDDISVN